SAFRVAGRSRARSAGSVVHRRAHRRREAGRRDRARRGAHSPPLHGGDRAEGLKTQVAIVGGGPAGLLLAELLDRQGVESVVLEKHSRERVLSRIRAGVLEPTTVEVLRENGLAGRLEREGHEHDGMWIVWAGRESFLIDVKRHLGKRFVAYGQTNLQEDLFAAADRRGATLITEAADVHPLDIESDQPYLRYTRHGKT